MLGEKLKAARIRAGLSLRQLQEEIGNAVTAQAIGKYERGEMQPSGEILAVLADALGVSGEYLRTPSGVKIEGIKFRENFIRSKKEKAQITATILGYVEGYLDIEERLQIESVQWDQPRGVPFPVRDLNDAEQAAHKVRDDWNLGSDPIQNLAEFLEDRGVKILIRSLPGSVAGITGFVNRQNSQRVPVIVVNGKVTGERQRFTLAHELGHLVLERTNTELNIERVCDRFAGAFLMPDRVLWATLGKYRRFISIGELASLKKYLGVSVQAIAHRCLDLNIINKSTHRRLYKVFSRRGYLQPPYDEPHPVDQEETRRFERLCFRALAEGVITNDKAAELLNIPINTISSEMECDY